MKFKELDGKSAAELASMLAEDKAHLHALGMKRAVNQLKDVREIRELRQRVARLKTKQTALKTKV